MTIRILPDPKHVCVWPMPDRGNPHWLQINQHWMPVGTVWECDGPDGCGELWISVKYPEVRSGQQMVGNYWERVSKLGYFKRKRIRRALRS